MPVCTSCGQENPEIARFCLACAAPLVEAEPTEARKTVTMVFTDLTGSTALGEGVDSETLRRVLDRYFDEMRRIVERHGGLVEKFVGDAVLGVFGIPDLHEDDAVRAVRAAAEMRDRMESLNEDLERTWSVRLAVRTGVNTGEVVTGDASAGERFATGDAVNIAARLEQAAPPGGILIGHETHRLVRDVVSAEPVAPLELKGKSKPVLAWRLESVGRGTGPTRRLDSRLVGRDDELTALLRAFDRAVSRHAAELVTVLGFAGVGKSRLATELAAAIADGATVLEGRCLPYGEGITFWPVAEMVKAAAGIDEADGPGEFATKVTALLPPEAADSADIAQRVAAAVSFGEASSSLQEVFWGVRRLFEALAARRPLVLVFDDLHWAEDALLDLVEYLVTWTTTCPVLILALARQELLDARPSLATPRSNATALLLEPLDERQSSALLENLAGGADLGAGFRGRLAAAAEGNPLFLEELVRMLVDDGVLAPENGAWRLAEDPAELAIPPTIGALLAARLERLSVGEQQVIQRASVIGRTFYWGAVAALSPPQSQAAVGGHLQTLVRRELISPDASTFVGEDAFRFGHILVRDAAYRLLAKERRADLHERFADWLVTRVAEHLPEFEEIVGYHLEQAVRLRGELRPLDAAGRELAARASGHLASAGKRALARGDVVAAANLLGRAVDAVPPGERPLEPMLDLAEAVTARGELDRAGRVLVQAVDLARERGDRRLETYARLQQLVLRLDTDPELAMGDVQRAAEEAFPIFHASGDELGLCRAWRAVAEVHLTGCRWGASAEALEEALAHAEQASASKEMVGILNHLANSLFWGPTPAAEGTRRCRQLPARADGARTVEANVVCYLAGFEAMQGRFEEARRLYTRGRELFEDLGHQVGLANHRLLSGTVEMLAGDPAAAERELRTGYGLLESMGETAVLSSIAGFLAEAVAAQERWDEALGLTEMSERLSQDEDVASQIAWRTTRAKALAARGELETAERLASEAKMLADGTDSTNMQADARLALGLVLRAAGRSVEAAGELGAATSLYERKGNVVSARRARVASEGLSAVR